uniref:G protein gamma domain-containing protein n=1 Tax=Panagrolaimus sp. ES5 TaxID=591445 RepID=A0AC34FGR2_9BILA
MNVGGKEKQPKTVGEAKKVIQQLKREKEILRAPVSAALQELVKNVQDAQKDDPFVRGFKENPFVPKTNIGLGGCLSVSF